MKFKIPSLSHQYKDPLLARRVRRDWKEKDFSTLWANYSIEAQSKGLTGKKLKAYVADKLFYSPEFNFDNIHQAHKAGYRKPVVTRSGKSSGEFTAALKNAPPLPMASSPAYSPGTSVIVEEKKKSMFISAKDSLMKSVLTTEDREDLKQKQFALPKKAEDKEEKGESGNYPIPDLSHARNALAMVARYGSSSEQAKVRAAVYKKYPELDKRKEEEQEKSMFISAKDSLMKSKGDKTGTETPHLDALKALAKKFGMALTPILEPKKGALKEGKLGYTSPAHKQSVPLTQTPTLENKSLNKAQKSAREEAKLRQLTREGWGVTKKAGVVPDEDEDEIVRDEDKKKFDKGTALDVGPVFEPKSLGKSVDPVLAARQNQVPISMIGAMARPVVGQTGFQNGVIQSNFQEGGFTLEDNSPRKLGGPRSK